MSLRKLVTCSSQKSLLFKFELKKRAVICSSFKFASSSTSNSRKNGDSSSSSSSSSVVSTFTDYVVVGAGSAGCVLANRLSTPCEPEGRSIGRPGPSVMLLEAGSSDQGLTRWTIKMPAALMYNLYDDKFNWFYHTEPQRHMNDRRMYWPRGRVLGGSSSLNAMVYIRGHALDFERWHNEGATGWNYANVLPYFKKSQTHELGADAYRGDSGPLHVSRGKTDHPLHKAWIQACQQAGHAFTEDINGFRQEGVGYFDMTIKDGSRCSTSVAYLHPVAKQRCNLSVETGAFAKRLLFDKDRVIGVEYEQKGQIRRAFADREVILAGGAINSPQLLMLSGIGDVDHLRSVGIDGWHHLPGVGQNLQDHLEVYVQHSCDKPVTLYKAQWKFPHVMIGIGLKWILTRKGWAATTHLETGAFSRSRPDVTHPDIQYHFLPSTVHDHGRKMGKQHAYQVHVGPMRPKSAGQLLLQSPDPRKYPLIDANYLACEEDREEMRACVRESRAIFSQPALREEFGGVELAPGASCQSDAEIDSFIRAFADSAYHPSCTCRMGSNPDGRTISTDEAKERGYVGNGRIDAAVTKSDCRVHGLEGLRIVDASIMPSVVSGNLNASVVMMAERASDLILSDYHKRDQMLPASHDADYWTPSHDQQSRDKLKSKQ